MTPVTKKIVSTFRSGVMSVSLAFGVSVVAASALPATVQAQQAINSIEVLVNDQPLSTFDINQRLRLVIAVSGGVKSEEEFLKVREQVINSMVDELLELQEAKTVDLVVPQAQLEDFFGRRAQGLGQTPEQLEQALAGIGSSKQSMQKQMEAEIAWSQLVEGRLGSFVSVSDEEVEARIQKIFDNRGKFEYRLAEIVMEVNSPEQAPSVKANADQLVEGLRSGSSFPEIAQQLSASPTAAVGGDLGWLTEEDFDTEFASFATSSSVGDISDPIRTPGGYVVLTLRDRRRILVADPLDTQVALQQLFLTKEAVGDDIQKMSHFKEAVKNLDKSVLKCGELEKVAEAVGADGPIDIGAFRLRDLHPAIRDTVAEMEENDISEALEMADGWHAILVCARQEAQIQEPDFDLIYNQIEQQRLAMMGRRYLRDLRRDAIVDYR